MKNTRTIKFKDIRDLKDNLGKLQGNPDPESEDGKILQELRSCCEELFAEELNNNPQSGYKDCGGNTASPETQTQTQTQTQENTMNARTEDKAEDKAASAKNTTAPAESKSFFSKVGDWASRNAGWLGLGAGVTLGFVAGVGAVRKLNSDELAEARQEGFAEATMGMAHE